MNDDEAREAMTVLLLGLESTIHPGSPRSVSDFVAHAEVPDAVEAVVAWMRDEGFTTKEKPR